MSSVRFQLSLAPAVMRCSCTVVGARQGKVIFSSKQAYIYVDKGLQMLSAITLITLIYQYQIFTSYYSLINLIYSRTVHLHPWPIDSSCATVHRKTKYSVFNFFVIVKFFLQA